MNIRKILKSTSARSDFMPAGPTATTVLERVRHLVQEMIRGEFAGVLDGQDEASRCLAPLVEHLCDQNFRMLTAMADIWVAQTSPLFAIAEMKTNMQDLSHQTGTITKAVTDLHAQTEEIGRATEAAVAEAQDVQAEAATGSETADAAVVSIGKSATVVNELASKVDALGGSIRQIASIVKVIEDIASQTNLLALNATIEAARAGEAGKGFAVVAGEVKTLSHQTARATEEIRQRIGDLQGSMEEITTSMTETGKSVQDGTRAVNQAGQTLKTIISSVDQVAIHVQSIAGTLQQQACATMKVGDNSETTVNASNGALETIKGLSTAVDRISELVQPRLQEFGKQMNDRSLVQLARSDHASFKKRVIDTLLGRGTTKDSDLPDHHGCRFGKWYDGLQDPALRASVAYGRIKDPHHRVHAHGKEALAQFQSGDYAAAVTAAGKMEHASQEVFAALDDMANLLAKGCSR
jgi:methyl-accepting chemotaxis protein